MLSFEAKGYTNPGEPVFIVAIFMRLARSANVREALHDDVYRQLEKVILNLLLDVFWRHTRTGGAQ